jgi:hypothetical protein
MVMADTISIAGKAIPKNAVLIGGAAAVSVIIYAYWKKSSGGNSSNAAVTADPSAGIDPSTGQPYADEFGAGMNYSGFGFNDPVTGATIGAYGTQTITQVTTNAQWAQAAQAYLVQQGYDPMKVSAAIGKVLSGQPITADEAAIWAAAVGYEGEPPMYVPPLNTSVPGGQNTGTTIKAPSGLHVTARGKNDIHLAWSAVTGATKGYHVYINGAYNRAASGTTSTVTGLHANTHYTFNVRGVDSKGNIGPGASVSTSTTK